MADPNVVLTASIDAGAPTPAPVGLTVALGSTVQLSGVNKSTWLGGAATRWEIYDYPFDFALPAGWLEESETGIYYSLGTDNPSPFDVDPWGKYVCRLLARGVVESQIIVSVLSPEGVEDIARKEGSEFWGSIKQWVGALQANLRLLDLAIAGGGGGGGYTQEQIEDILGGSTLQTSATVALTYNDGANTISFGVVPGSIGMTQLVAAPSAGFIGATGAGAYSHRTVAQTTAALDVATSSLKGLQSAADKAKADRETGYRSVTHTSGSVTDALTTTSVRYQRLDASGGTGDYTYELPDPATAGTEFIFDVTVGTSGMDVLILDGTGGPIRAFVNESTVARRVIWHATFNGADWRVAPIGDGNTEGDAAFTGLQINNSTGQAGTGPEKANWDHSHAHGNRSGGTLHSAATASTNGFQAAADFKKQLDGGGVAYRAKLALDIAAAAADTDMVDGATVNIDVAASTHTLIEVHISCYRKVVYNTEGGSATSRSTFAGTFRGAVRRDAVEGTTPLVEIEASAGDTMWVLEGTAGKLLRVKPITVAGAGAFKLQVVHEQVNAADFAGALSITSAVANIAATVNLYPVATIA
jgi:hypothetical protein